uniref:Saposin B-type domain-containing protein n=1 Tax=Acanthochromis polyacanthus TaxID=80966 RepID=A0A3Q1GNF9_9TELE
MCTVCETVIKTVEGLLSKQRTEKAVADALKKACHMLPFGMGGLCETMVDKYSKELIHLLLENASPRTICSAIRMCQLFEKSFQGVSTQH